MENEWYSLDVVATHNTYVTRACDPSSSWDADDLAHSYSYDGFIYTTIKPSINRKAPTAFSNFVVPWKPEANREYYMVVVQHTDGDSVHTETGLQSQIEIYDSLDIAEDCVQRIKIDYDRSRNNIDVGQNYPGLMIPHTDGRGYRKLYSGYWTGYFTELERVFIQPIRLFVVN